jgi:hypothetical protein
VNPPSYVRAVCNAVRTWATDIQAKSGALNIATITNAAQGKSAIQQFFRAAVSDTGAVVGKLRAAGTPHVPDGTRIANALVSSFDEIDTALTKGESTADALPIADPTMFRNSGEALANDVRQSLSGIGAGLSGLKSPALAAAANREPGCASLGA